jgi:hypothetical protein
MPPWTEVIYEPMLTPKSQLKLLELGWAFIWWCWASSKNTDLLFVEDEKHFDEEQIFVSFSLTTNNKELILV